MHGVRHPVSTKVPAYLAVKLAVVCIADMVSSFLPLGNHLWEKSLQRHRFIG